LSKPSFLTESFGRRSLSIVLALILLPIITLSEVASSQEGSETERQKTYRRLVETYLKTGQKEYDEGHFEEAVKTFQMAQGYEEYLTAATRELLSEELEKSQIAVLKRKRALDTFRTVNDLIKQDQLKQAKTYLEKIKDNEFLTEQELKQIAEVFRQIDAQVMEAEIQSQRATNQRITAEQKPVEPTAVVKKPVVSLDARRKETFDLLNDSIALYHTGQLEKAREGFVKVASSELLPPQLRDRVKDYIAQIDRLLPAEQKLVQESEKPVVMAVENAEEAEAGQLTMEAVPEPTAPTTAPKVASPVTGESSYIDVINRKRNTIRSYTKAIVNDAIAKAGEYITKSEFDKARNEIETAALTVNKNQMHLGDELFKEYSSMLKVMAEEIADKEREKIRQQEQQRREQAAEANRRFREQMEIDRENRIAELMENALTYQKQQRYEAALGQLKNLLALDPQNEQAKILKDTLEDMIFFRKQIEVKRESERQRAKILLKTDESGIPYAEELTYPPYWKELIEKPTRQPDKPIGLDPLDAIVYEQLEKVVDLSNLSPGMSFGEVVEILKNSVDPPIQIQPNWKDLLENAEVEQATPAGMDPLTGIKLRKAIEILIAGVTSAQLGEFGEITYVVDEGVVLIGTVDMLPPKMVHRVYDVSDLVAEPANYGQIGRMLGMQNMMMASQGGMMGGMMGGGMMGGMGGGMMGGGMGMGGMGGYGGGMMGGMGGMMGGGMMGGMGGYGGGMMGGGMGGMGMGGMGMGGGMGGYGGGMMGGMGMGGMGMGGMGMGGGMYGGGMMGGQASMMQAQSLLQLIQETIEPDSWFDLSETGEGTIMAYPIQQPRKLAVMQTHEVHQEIEKLLEAMRVSLGNQVAIEAVFLVVTENYLEDIGLDVDFSLNLGSKWGQLSFEQSSAVASTPDISTKIGGSLGGIEAAATVTGGYGSILDDLQVSFLLRAVQAHTDSKAITAPKNTVLSGESAAFSVSDLVTYALPPNTQTGVTGTGVGTSTVQQGTQQQIGFISVGSMLSITPTISHDKKYVLLNIVTTLTDLLRLRTHQVEQVVTTGTVVDTQEYEVTVPETETSSVMTRVSVPDGGTLLLGGQKITAEVEKEAGVPILSKIPIVGRLFSNRSTIRDQKVLLILVKPVIMLQEEREAEAIAGMESEF